jgi:RNA polymerase-binding transcription factor DksA
MISEQELIERKAELSKRRDELLNRLDAIKKDIGSGLDPDWEEQATQLENAEVLEEISRVTAEELNTVQSGIERLEKAIAQLHKD